MSTSRTIEIGEITAGIVVEERPKHLRFYAAETLFRSLEARPFKSARQAELAAQAIVRRRTDVAERHGHPPAETLRDAA